MIDKLQRIAKTIQILRLPSIFVGLFSLATMVWIMFISSSNESDQFVIPSVVGLLWAISAYFFIVYFRSVPGKTNNSLNFISKLKRNIIRGWYWFTGIFFLGTTAAVMIVTWRMVSIWLRDYGG